MRVYIDTSVFGGYYDIEFKHETILLFKEIKNKKKIPVISEIVIAELENAPANIKALFNKYYEFYEIAFVNDEIMLLAKKYIKEKALPPKSINDAVHIATATYYKVDVLTSWNFKHIVNLNRIHSINAVNLKNGYQITEIRNPKEIIEL
ncbi:MAG: type II toxin-antitoxin system VapC family toxin [Bacteroidetes bacterium]|nr:type II toxin-antitoxin system VapC family toxin [Bacteroidota bacterium]